MEKGIFANEEFLEILRAAKHEMMGDERWRMEVFRISI